MITGEIKNKVDKIWEIFWTGGVTNPLTVIEQFTYLLYMKTLDEQEQEKEKDMEILGLSYEGFFPKDKPQLRWYIFANMGAEEMLEIVTKEVFPFIKTMGGKQSV